MTGDQQPTRTSLRRLHDAISHLQAGSVALACSLAAAMLVPLPWGRILAVGSLVTALVFYVVVPRQQ